MSNAPLHQYIPATCTAPGPTDNSGGEYWFWDGGYNSFGVYLPGGWYSLDPSLIDLSDTARDLISQYTDPAYAPPLPPWIPTVSDSDSSGNYWFAGGYMPTGKYIGEGWYQPIEFYG